MRLSTFLSLALLLPACSSGGCDGADPANAEAGTADASHAGEGSGSGGSASGDAGATDDATTACPPGASVVQLTTSDNVTLEADLIVPASASGAVVLVHMIPPSWDRTSWPLRVRQTLADLGYVVLSIDRRGAGGSGGVAEDAYTGDGGRLDVEAAARFLSTLPATCGADLDRFVLIGASNGTTSVLDYTIAHGEGLPDPLAVAWLSPGEYTENQHTIVDHRDIVEPIPTLIIYPASEPWSQRFVEQQPGSWSLVELADGVHGTQNFDDGALEAAVMEALTDLLRQ